MDPAAAIALVPKSVAESWVWYVFNPQIEHCAQEHEILPRTLTFRYGTRKFERLLSMRDALLPAGRAVFDDMRGELQDYDELVDRHDGSLKSLHAVAGMLYQWLLDSAEFRSEIDELLAQWKGRSRLLPQSVDGDPMIVAYEAERVVNDLGPNVEPNYIDHELWNSAHERLKSHAPAELISERDRMKRVLSEAVDGARHGLIQLRRQISRTLDIPVVPVR